ncbi:MAG: DUF3068 domain-containing protein [Nocardioides sp.]
MRKLRFVLALLGGFLVVSAALVKFYMADTMEKTPLNIDSTTHLSGSGQILDTKAGGTKAIKVNAVSVNKAVGKLSDGDVVSWANTTCAVIVEGETPDCLPPNNPQTVSWDQDTFATHRVDALAVNDAKYVPDEPVQHEGLVNKFPFNTQKKSYLYWDGTAGKAVDMAFAGTKTVDGTELYVFQEKISDVPIQVAKGVPGTYAMDRTLWVEPVTGSIVNQVQHDVRKLSNGDLALDLSLAFTADQVSKSLGDAKSSAAQLNGLHGWIPLVLLIVGLVALAVSFVIGRRHTSSKHAAQAA